MTTTASRRSCSVSHPKSPKALGHGPATQEIYLVVMVEDDDGVLLSQFIHNRALLHEQSALSPRPPLQQHDYLWTEKYINKEDRSYCF